MPYLQGKQGGELQHKVGQLQATIAELESTAQQEMHALANESKAAITAVQSKFISANAQLLEFHKFIKVIIFFCIPHLIGNQHVHPSVHHATICP